MNEENEGFFKRVKAWVRENNTTIESLMNSVGGTQDVYYGWRQGDKLPSGTYICKLAKAMGVSMEWLATGKEATTEGFSPSPNEKRLLRAFEVLDGFDQQTLIDMAESLQQRHTSQSALKEA